MALNGLAGIICTSEDATLRNGPEALRMAGRAAELTGRKDPEILKTLAAAYAELGNFVEAISTIEMAERAALELHRGELAKECHRMLEQFRASKPWRASEHSD